ncbi:unnamed protein product [Adineta ricciae]|uniref:Uncharacterized protein n=1 Tax=Adineta ricciae TaxID=249248 RepID=A0A815REB9_ADIRI|nr:unnamed protein product [Adineta ricciae]
MEAMYWQKVRDTFMQGIGVLAASLALAGLNASNNEFNGRLIDRYRCSKLFTDYMFVRRFYIHETLIRHNFVVFQTDTRHTFKVHLIADIYSGRRYSPVYVDIVPTYWKPTGRRVRRCNKNARGLKNFVKREVQKFGDYEVGINDCRHFARAVAAYLSH